MFMIHIHLISDEEHFNKLLTKIIIYVGKLKK